MDKAEYDAQAADYDKSRFNDSLGRHLDYMHKKILTQLVDPSTKLLLEAGVGTGRFATWLTKKGFRVVGLDISREMLKKTKEKNRVLNCDVELIVADVHFLPFRKNIFDNCICVNVMDHLSNITEFFKEVSYAIKSEGSFIFNFSNIHSPYLPIALVVNFKKQAMFKGGRIQSRWLTFKDVDSFISRNGFIIKDVKGCFFASPLPLGNLLIKFIQTINFSAENSGLKFLAGSPFIKVGLTKSSY